MKEYHTFFQALIFIFADNFDLFRFCILKTNRCSMPMKKGQNILAETLKKTTLIIKNVLNILFQVSFLLDTTQIISILVLITNILLTF